MEVPQLWHPCHVGTGPSNLGLLEAQEIKEPEDGEERTASTFLYSSLLGVEKLEIISCLYASITIIVRVLELFHMIDKI